MKILLTCTECEFEHQGSSEKELMNKIVMWNHIKREHPKTAERLMRVHETFPGNLFRTHKISPAY